MHHPRTTLPALTGAIGAVALALAAGPAAATTRGRLEIDSIASNAQQGDQTSLQPDVTPDGRFVVFASDATNLVPGDTNENSDVFVRDRVTGVTERVSIAWNGMESRGDSSCPAISSDGRFVAFLSDGWNMYPGGQNLGDRSLRLFVRDRQSGSTKHLSPTVDGRALQSVIYCPIDISGDGRLVVFATEAGNLVAGDRNGQADVFLADQLAGTVQRMTVGADGKEPDDASLWPAISPDGRFVAFSSAARNLMLPVRSKHDFQVYVRDVATGALEVASVASGAPGERGDGESYDVSFSDDGRFVAFASVSNNLAPVTGPTWVYRIYVRDRIAATTTLASPEDPSVADCGRPDKDFWCGSDHSWQPSISADGRFVSFASTSGKLVPGNAYQGTQTYLFDRIGGRLRRLSVDRAGVEGNNCSDDAVLSADGTFLVYRSKATLLPGDANGAVDVYGQQWNCGATGACRRLALCPATPQSCIGADRAKLRLQKRAPGGTGRDRLFWSWRSSQPGSDAPFPLPDADSLYQLCVYAKPERRLAIDLASADARECIGSKAPPCWDHKPTGYKLVAGNVGIDKLTLRDAAGAKRIVLRGAGEMLDLPPLPLDGSQGITVQLQERDSGRCWSADFPADAIFENRAGSATPGASRVGKLVASFE